MVGVVVDLFVTRGCFEAGIDIDDIGQEDASLGIEQFSHVVGEFLGREVPGHAEVVEGVSINEVVLGLVGASELIFNEVPSVTELGAA